MAVNESSTIDLEGSQSIKNCISCNELNDDIKYCMTCHGDCCQSCINISHKDHNILPSQHPIVKSFKRFLSNTCALHKNESLSMYCYTCKRPSCLSCVGETHDGHSMSTIQSLASQADLLYSKLIDDLPKAKSIYSNKKAGYDDYVDSVDEAITEIKGQFGKLRTSIDEMESSMLQPLEKEENDVRRRRSDNEKLLQEAEILTHLFKSASEDDYLQRAAFVTNYPCLETFYFEEDSLPEPVSFNPVQMNIPCTDDLIGSIKRCNGKYFQLDDSHKASNDVPVLEMISLKSVKKVRIEGRVLPLPDGRKWLISDTSHCEKTRISSFEISIFDESFKLEHILTIQEKTRRKKWDPLISIIGPSDLLYTMHKEIWRVSTSGSRSLILDTSPVTLKGICCTMNERLVLGLSDRGRSLIRIYSLNDLKPFGEIEKDENGEPIFSSIKSITENGKGDLIVHDSKDLLCVNKQGSLLWKLKKDFEFFCCDRFSNVVVATEEEIRVLDCNGKYVKTLLTVFDFLTEPTSLFIDIEGLLWIGQYENIKVLKYWK